jgi:hypothetical protein
MENELLSVYEAMPVEFRLMALGLTLSPPNPPGRPRTLTFQRRLEVGVLWRETYDGLAVRRSTKDPRLAPVLKQIRRAKNAAPWRIAELSRKADRIGRHYRVEILPPEERLPEIDRLVAEKIGLTERMVRKARSDKRIIRLVGLPIWVPRAWEIEAAQDIWAQQAARRLLTPERLAKPIHIIPACGTIGIKELIEQDGSKPFRTGSELEVNGPAPRGYHGGVFNAAPRNRPDLVERSRRALAHWMEAKRVREPWDELWEEFRSKTGPEGEL